MSRKPSTITPKKKKGSCQTKIIEQKKKVMIYLYPEKHADMLDLEALVLRANRGDIFLLMEDGPTASMFKSPFINALEPVVMMSPDTMLACMVMMTDTTHETIGALPGTEGFVLYSMLVKMLGAYPDDRFAGLNYVAQELDRMPIQNLPELYYNVKNISDTLMGGVPSSVKTGEIRQYVEDLCTARTGLIAKQHMALYNFIKREKIMADTIQSVTAAHPDLDVHVIVGACHISGELTNDFLQTLAVNVPSYQELTRLIEEYYPKQRLLDFIGDHVIR